MTRHKKDMTLTYYIALFLILILCMGIGMAIGRTFFWPDNAGAYERPFDPSPETVTVEDSQSVKAKEIITMFFGSEADSAIKVSTCESGLNPKAKSKTSTAKGLFQIIAGTWKGNRCDGDPLNPVDNTRCAKKIFDANKKWNTSSGWEASYPCHGQI